MTTIFEKIATALDCLADDLDAQPVATPAPVPAEEKTASSAETFRELFRQHTGEEPSDAVLDKLAALDGPELQETFGKLLKTAARERPTPLGEPSDQNAGDSAPPSTREGAKLAAWEAFGEALLSGDS